MCVWKWSRWATRWVQEFPKATYHQLLRAHSKDYIRSIDKLRKTVEQSGVSVPLTPYLQREKNPAVERTKVRRARHARVTVLLGLYYL